MCIICNGGQSEAAVEAASRFLRAYGRAQDALDEATRAMLVVSRTMPENSDRKRYDQMHKKMRRFTRDWNRLEQEREEGMKE